MGKQKDMPQLKVAGQDHRAAMYRKIVMQHQSIVETEHRAQNAGVRPGLTQSDAMRLVLHCEASIAFLAEELLKLGKLVESGPEIET